MSRAVTRVSLLSFISEAVTRHTHDGRPSHTVPLLGNLSATGDCSFSVNVISVLESERGVTARFWLTNTWVLAEFRIEMRLLSETRSVLEYLSRLSVNIDRCKGDREARISQFS